jgi:hypothetical protein
MLTALETLMAATKLEWSGADLYADEVQGRTPWPNCCALYVVRGG